MDRNREQGRKQWGRGGNVRPIEKASKRAKKTMNDREEQERERESK